MPRLSSSTMVETATGSGTKASGPSSARVPCQIVLSRSQTTHLAVRFFLTSSLGSRDALGVKLGTIWVAPDAYSNRQKLTRPQITSRPAGTPNDDICTKQ